MGRLAIVVLLSIALIGCGAPQRMAGDWRTGDDRGVWELAEDGSMEFDFDAGDRGFLITGSWDYADEVLTLTTDAVTVRPPDDDPYDLPGDVSTFDVRWIDVETIEVTDEDGGSAIWMKDMSASD